jgi:hypothetical protein
MVVVDNISRYRAKRCDDDRRCRCLEAFPVPCFQKSKLAGHDASSPEQETNSLITEERMSGLTGGFLAMQSTTPDQQTTAQVRAPAEIFERFAKAVAEMARLERRQGNNEH